MADTMLEEIQRRLKEKTIHELRQLARAVGVPRPAQGKKERLLDLISDIAMGTSDPVPPSARGAHPKSDEYDRQLVADILRCRELNLSVKGEISEDDAGTVMTVGSGVEYDPLDFRASGMLEKTNGKWFMRVNGCREDLYSDVFVADYFIKNFALRTGDFLYAKCKRSSPDEIAGVVSIITVNGSASYIEPRHNFDELTPVYPSRRLKTSNKIIDLFAPVGAGQRAFILGRRGTGKTRLLKELARGLKDNNPGIKLIILSIDCGPEEEAELSMNFSDSDVFTSSYGVGANGHVHTAMLALEYAKRNVEANANVVLILDDITRLTRAYNYCGKQVSASLDCSAIDSAKAFISSARNTKEGGSLTIITALDIDDDDPVDGNIYRGLKDVCSMKITLASRVVRSRSYLPVELSETYSSMDDRLLSDEELELADKLRGEDLESIIEQLK